MSLFDLDTISPGLPAASLLPALSTTPEQHLVIQAPPGTGKTTLVPPALSNAFRTDGQDGLVLVTAPRRVAVRAAARRLAQLDGSRLGEKVGFSVRGEHHGGDRVQFVTPGVLLRRVLSDPELPGVRAVILDEVHERQLDTDLLLGMLAELGQLREDLTLVAMSATLDTQRFSDLLGGARVLTAEVPTFPIDITYVPGPGPRLGQRGVEYVFLDHLAHTADEALARTGHSVLVFVPGVREIDRVMSSLTSHNVLPLHGRLTTAEQDRALTPGSEPRIVVSTPVAESSLTVPGVRVVVDSGLTRVPRRDAARGMTGLVTVSCARSSADQRAGRAGREGPGEVVRCYSHSDYQHAQPYVTPEINSADLTQATLWLACWGTPRGDDLPLIDAPPSPTISSAESRLQRLGALDEFGSATAFGRRLAALPLEPQVGAALLRHGAQAADTVAVIAEVGKGDVAKQSPQPREVRRLRKLVEDLGPTDPGIVTATAFPDLIARKETPGEYLLASGTRATLHDASLLDAEWLAVAAVTRSGDRAIIRAAAHLSREQAESITPPTDTVVATVIGGKLQARRIKQLGAIELSSTPVRATGEVAAEALAEHVRREGPAMFTFSDKAQSLRERLSFLHETRGEPWPDVDSADPQLWLGPELAAIAAGTPVTRIDMYQALTRLLPWPEATSLDELAPSHLTVPSGHRHRLDYSTGRPVVRVKLQECFGLAESPTFCGAAVQFHLLSPAGRPLAVTDDLASFWSGPYSQVRSEMRGRYPKHPWPEDPWSAPPTARTRNRM